MKDTLTEINEYSIAVLILKIHRKIEKSWNEKKNIYELTLREAIEEYVSSNILFNLIFNAFMEDNDITLKLASHKLGVNKFDYKKIKALKFKDFRNDWQYKAFLETEKLLFDRKSWGDVPLSQFEENNVQHIVEMRHEIEENNMTGAKLGRWLGWAQAIAFSTKIVSLEEMKDINRRLSNGD